MILISACLCGIKCKYNGEDNSDPFYVNLVKSRMAIPLCPEQLGGLPTPRPACEIRQGTGADVWAGLARVVNADGGDVTDRFIKGACETLRFVNRAGISEAVLQSRSPSCGAGQVYDGTFSRRLIQGDGVTAALLKSKGIKVWNNEEFKAVKGV